MKKPLSHPPFRHASLTKHVRQLILTAGALLALTFLLLFGLDVLPSWAQSQATGDLIEVLSFEDTTCYFLTWRDDWLDPVQHAYKTVDIAITIPYTGDIEEATLLLRSANVRDGSRHPIVINGVDTGYAPPPDTYSSCDPPRPAIREYPLDLTQVPIHPGVNIVRLTTENTSDNWGADYVAIRVKGRDIKGGRFVDILFPGEDGAMVNAVVLEPFDGQPHSPMLLLFHGWRGAPIDPFFTDYTPAALEQGWLAVSPQQRGENALGPGGQPLASLTSQRDAFKLLDYMRTHYQIDGDRVYVGGFSMGGMMAGMMAAKYPDAFAAAVTHMAITDLRDWYDQVGDYRQSQIITETGGAPWEIPFEYDRRSPKEMASNLKTLPIAVVHGISDTVVPPQHAQDFYDAIMTSSPVRAELQWYEGGHEPSQTLPYGGAWAVNFMKDYVRNPNPATLRIRTDEAKSFYWLTIQPRKYGAWNTFTQVDVDVAADDERIIATVQDNAVVDLRFDLAQMGFDARVSYVISQTNDALGSSIEAVTPLDGQLHVTAPRGVTQLEIFPNRGNMPVAIVLQRGKDGYQGVTDAWINAWAADSNYGQRDDIYLRSGGVQRGLIRFDLEGLLPDRIQITSADLYLYDNANGPDMTVNLHPLQKDWAEMGVTFNQAANGRPWSQPGGDYETTPAATLHLTGNSPGYASTSILDMVREWRAHPENNHGLLLMAQAGNSQARTLKSSEYWDAEKRPYLKIIYQPLPSLGEVSGVAYEDSNGNRNYDPGEPLLAGAVVRLLQDGTLLQEQTTGSNGAYRFTDLEAGVYQLQEAPPPGYASARPSGNVFFTIAEGDELIFHFAHDPRHFLPLLIR